MGGKGTHPPKLPRSPPRGRSPSPKKGSKLKRAGSQDAARIEKLAGKALVKHASSLKRAISQDAARIDKLADKALKNIRRMQEMRPAGRGIVEAQMGPPPGLLKHLAVLKAPCPLGGLEGARNFPSRAFSPRTPGLGESVLAGPPAPANGPREPWMFPTQRSESNGDSTSGGLPSDKDLTRASSMPDPSMSGLALEEDLLFDFGEVPPPLGVPLGVPLQSLEVPIPFPRDLGELQLSAAQLLDDNSALYPDKNRVRTLSGSLHLEEVTAALLRFRAPPGQHSPATC